MRDRVLRELALGYQMLREQRRQPDGKDGGYPDECHLHTRGQKAAQGSTGDQEGLQTGPAGLGPATSGTTHTTTV